jgi:PAS domain S-box-containing protein
MKTLDKEEAARLDALDQFEVLAAAPDPALEEITRLAADLCNTPMAGLEFLGPDAIYYQARIGEGPERITRGKRACELAVAGDTGFATPAFESRVFEIPDARYHPLFRPDGIMIAGRAIRFYAAAPLTTATGVKIGTLFVQDSVPHTLTEKQRRGLATLSRQVMARLELNHRARYMDRDGQARHRVESALTVERNFVATVLDTVGALVAVFDTAGRIVRFNRTCEQVTGYDFSQLEGRFFWDKLIPAPDIPAAIAEFEQLRAGNFPANFENFWRTSDGHLRRIAWSATALVDPQGQTNFLIATGIDVTLQREAEATLRESEARYRQLVEGSLGMVYTHDLAGKVLSVNKHGAESLGLAAEQMIGQPLTRFTVEDDRSVFPTYLAEVIRHGEAQGRLRLIDRDGDVRVLAFRNKLIEASSEGFRRDPYVLGFGVDISDQVRAEEKLRALIHQSNSILESVGDGIYGLDLDGRVTVINPAAAAMLGYKPDELLGVELHRLIHHSRADGSPYPPEESPILDSIRNRDTVRVANEVFWRKDGTSFPVEYVARPQLDYVEGDANATGKVIGVVVAFADTTERRALDRMKDEFISTVSHELRTPLTSLRAALGLVTGGALAKRPEKMKQMLEIAIGNTDRLIRLVNDILDIERISSGGAELHSMLCSASALLERSCELQQAAALKAQVRTVISAPPGLEVWADPDRILQALANLLSNAIKFSPRGGTIDLTARLSPDDPNQALFEVHDTGRGVPPDKLERIFERFQQVDASDSRDMGGTGLGLAICRSIIDQHGGRIWASSPLGDGATFHFTLPLKPSHHLR